MTPNPHANPIPNILTGLRLFAGVVMFLILAGAAPQGLPFLPPDFLSPSDQFRFARTAFIIFIVAASTDWIDGVLTMGLPPSAEIAWRWTDVTAWFTRRDPAEPSFAPGDVIAAVAPVPLFMIQSRKDEYVAPADYERLLFQTLLKLPHVTDVRSDFALRTVKAHGPLPLG